jgi:hypothetical protein
VTRELRGTGEGMTKVNSPMTTTNASGATLESHTVSYLDGGGIFDDGFRTQDVYTQQQPSGSTPPSPSSAPPATPTTPATGC